MVEMTRVKIRRWAEHIPRGKDVNDCFIALGWTPEGRRERRRPRTVEEERTKARWKGWEVGKAVALDRKC